MSHLVFPIAGALFCFAAALATIALIGALFANHAGHRVPARILFGLFVAIALASAVGALGIANTTRIEFWIDRPHLEEAARRGDALAAAIEEFEAVHGVPPESLQDLVPRFLDRLAGTGWWMYPSFVYQRNSDGTWRLWIETTRLGAFDQFVYDPEHTQPEEPGYIDRVGDWYYLHE